MQKPDGSYITQYRPIGMHARKNSANERERESRGAHQDAPRMDRRQSIKARQLDADLAARVDQYLAVHYPIIAEQAERMARDTSFHHREERRASGKEEFLLFRIPPKDCAAGEQS